MANVRDWISAHPVPAVALGSGALAVFIVAPLMWFDTHGGGEYFGAVVGFGALLAGALFNAHLERERDRRLLRIDTAGAVFSTAMEVSRNIRLLVQIENLVQTGNMDRYKWKSVSSTLAVMSNATFHRNSEKFTIGAILTDRFDDRLINAYMLIVPSLQEHTKSLIESEVINNWDNSDAVVAHFLLLVRGAHQAADEALENMLGVFSTLSGFDGVHSGHATASPSSAIGPT